MDHGLIKSCLVLLHVPLMLAVLLVLSKLRQKNGKLVPAFALVASFGFLSISFLISDPGWLFSDYYKAYFPAGVHALSGPSPEFVALLARRDFVNLPVVALFFTPLSWLGEPASGYAFLLLGLAGSYLCLRWLGRLGQLDTFEQWQLIFLACANGPWIYSFREGNTTHLILLGVVGAMLLLRDRREFAAGCLFGLLAVIKLPLFLFGLYMLARRRFRVVLGGTTIIALSVALSTVIYGWGLQVFWFNNCIKPFLGNPIQAYNSQSIASFWSRFFADPILLSNWDPAPFSAAAGSWTRWSTIAVLIALVAASVWRQRSRSSPTDGPTTTALVELEIALVLTAALLTTALAWSHYYLWLLLPFVLVTAQKSPFAASPRLKKATWLGLLLTTPTVHYFPISDPTGFELYGRLLVSHVFLGAILVYAALVLIRARSSRLIVQSEQRVELVERTAS